MSYPLNIQPKPDGLDDDNDEVNIAEYFDIILDNRWFIALIASIVLVLGLAYAMLARPVYEANLMVQVEDSEKSAGSFLGDAASSLFDVKTPAAGEIEIIKSRMILGQAVENTKFYIDARPKYVPLVGGWLARRASELSDPGIFGFGGYVSGIESISVPQFEIPQALESVKATVTKGEGGNYILSFPNVAETFSGLVGRDLIGQIDGSSFRLRISSIEAKPGAQFELMRHSKLLTLGDLQQSIKVLERGKQSGVIDVSLQSTDPEKLTVFLNEVGRLYVRQNIDRKAAEALKTLSFLDVQLPHFKEQLEQSEDIYNKFRNQNGTVSLDEEAKGALAQVVTLQASLLEAQQKRRELLSRFMEKHPSVQALDSQIKAWSAEIGVVNAKIKQMPILQQDTVRMQRDIKVNTDVYQSMLNSSLQMQLAKEGKVGNVRILDEAVIPEESVKPRRGLIVLVAAVIGIFAGIASAIVRNSVFGGIRGPQEIEASTGLNVYSTIPLSTSQSKLASDAANKISGIHLLADISPQDPAIESLRSLRTALQFAMLEAENNRVLITGATPGVGKSFVSANFAAIMAASGKRVLLIDADLRKGYINQYLGLSRKNGLSELIAGGATLEDCIHAQVLPNLDFISTGVLPPNPAELLMSESFSRVLSLVSAEYSLIIIDTPPVLVAADTSAVAPHAGTVLLVARADHTHLGEIQESAKRLAHAGKGVTGVIFNAMDLSRRHAGRHSYKYGAYKYTEYNYVTRKD